MAISNEELLRKATLETGDFGGAGEAPLSIEQVDRFLVLLAQEQAILPDVRRVTSNANKWQESILDFNARILRSANSAAGGAVEATRLQAADRIKPGTGIVEISTNLLRGEVPVSDEAMEDAAARANFADDLMTGLASRVGQDVEDLLINGDTGDADTFLATDDGWWKKVVDNGNTYNATNDGQDYQTIFNKTLQNMPERHKRSLANDGRYYVVRRLEEKYRDSLAARGTNLGDVMLTGRNELRYQGILIKSSPTIDIASNLTEVMLTNRNNLYAGFRREVTFETWRDPREGATSFVVTVRVDAEVAVPAAAVVAQNVDVTT